DLGLRERRVEPDAPRGSPMPGRRLDRIAPLGTREIRVVEDELANTGGQLLVERDGEVAQRPSALVAVEPDVAAGDVLLRDAALPRARDAHDEHDVGGAVGLRSFRPDRTRPTEREIEDLPVPRVEDESRRTGGGAGRL